MKKLLYILLFVPLAGFGQESDWIIKHNKIQLKKTYSLSENGTYTLYLPALKNPFKKNNISFFEIEDFINFVFELDSVFNNTNVTINEFSYKISRYYKPNSLNDSFCKVTFPNGQSIISQHPFYDKLFPYAYVLKSKLISELNSNNYDQKFTKPPKSMYTISALNLRTEPNLDSEIKKVLSKNQKINIQNLDKNWSIVVDNENVIIGYISSHYLSVDKVITRPKPIVRYNIVDVPFNEQKKIWREVILAQDKATAECDYLYGYGSEWSSCYNYRAKKYEEVAFKKNYITRDVWGDILHRGLTNKWSLPG